MGNLESSELIVTPKGEIYHLGIRPEDLAQKVIIVGDQNRVAVVSNFFDEITHKSQHREFVCHTGTYKGKRISAISTGIGVGNIDITLNELDALVNIDLNTRLEKREKTSLEIVRIGTCGILHDEVSVDSFILSSHAFGIDNIGHFYAPTVDKKTKKLEQLLIENVYLPKGIIPYLAPASEELVNRLDSEQVVKGITVTSPGFYGPQGRSLRLQLAEERMLDSFSEFKHEQHQFANLEMECSAFFSLANALGHKSTAVCLGLANRRKGEFTSNYSTKIVELIQYVLDRL